MLAREVAPHLLARPGDVFVGHFHTQVLPQTTQRLARPGRPIGLTDSFDEREHLFLLLSRQRLHAGEDLIERGHASVPPNAAIRPPQPPRTRRPRTARHPTATTPCRISARPCSTQRDNFPRAARLERRHPDLARRVSGVREAHGRDRNVVIGATRRKLRRDEIRCEGYGRVLDPRQAGQLNSRCEHGPRDRAPLGSSRVAHSPRRQVRRWRRSFALTTWAFREPVQTRPLPSISPRRPRASSTSGSYAATTSMPCSR